MSALWSSYVPQHVIDDIVQHNGDVIGRERRFEAVALFADVSGFTAISEALGRSGRHGTEELTSILNSYFEPMIALIQSYGGVIGKFGGDSMTVLFPIQGTGDRGQGTGGGRQGTGGGRRETGDGRRETGDRGQETGDKETRRQGDKETRRSLPSVVGRRSRVARQAIQCALDMQAEMHRYRAIATSVGTFALAMKAGLAIGTVFCTTVGTPDIRLEYLIAGGVLDRCADAEHHASKGEVVVHNELLEYAGKLTIVEARGGFSCVGRLRRPAPPTPLAEGGPLGPQAISSIAAFLHPSIAQRLRLEQIGLINEHRNVTVLFVSFSGFDYNDDPHVGAKLQLYFQAVINIVHRYDGYLNKVDMGDKGSKYIILFGAPVAHEDDQERGIRCALDLLALRSPASDLRIGITTGFVYCGQVGSRLRQEYTVMGDPVNLAARLMQAARPGQALTSQVARQGVIEQFSWEQIPALRVKGKSALIQAYSVQGITVPPGLRFREPAYSLPMVGRADELDRARAILERARAGRGQILGISAEAGMGKSRLNAEVVRLASEGGFTTFGGACQSYGTASSYLVWHDIWREFFGVNPSWSHTQQVQHLEQALASIDARFVQRLPLLGVALNIPIPDNDLTRSLDIQLRADLLKSLLLSCLRARWRVRRPEHSEHDHQHAEPLLSARPPALLVALEDCHWIDPLSQDLLEFIGRNIVDLPILLVVLYRPAPNQAGPLEWAGRAAYVGEIHLAQLPPEQAKQLIGLKMRQIWNDEAATATLAGQLIERAQGNPFYLEELVNYIRDRGVDPADAAALATLDLPDSLHRLILSRIDQLAEQEKTTLKVASVIGRLFKASWLWGSYPPLGSPDEVKQHLLHLSRLDLTPLDKPEPELEYLFKHITTQEVAYESLAFATRATLHAHIGGFIERRYSDSLAQFLDVLAYHYGRSHNVEKQRIYFRRAGDKAKATYASQAAIDYYQQLLTILPDADQGDVLVELGEVWQLIGKWHDAEAVYQKALALAAATNNRQLHARCQTALGSLLSQTESYEQALRRLRDACDMFEQQRDLRNLARALEHASFAYVQLGNYNQALDCAQQQLQIAQTHHDQVSACAALASIGLVYLRKGDSKQARSFLQSALDTALACNARKIAVHAGADLAGVYWHQGDFTDALASLAQAIRLANEIDYRQAVGFTTGNAGTIFLHLGDYHGALACYSQALRVASEMNDLPSILFFLTNIAIVYTEQKHYQSAETLFTMAIRLARKLNIPFALCQCLHRMGELFVRTQRLEEAHQLLGDALTLARQLDLRDDELELEVLQLQVTLALGQTDTQQVAEQLHQRLAARTEQAEQALIHYTLWRIDPSRDDSRQAASLYRALYQQSPNIEYRQRYAELTGEQLPLPPPLPALPEETLGPSVDIDTLVEQVEAMCSSALFR